MRTKEGEMGRTGGQRYTSFDVRGDVGESFRRPMKDLSALAGSAQVSSGGTY